MVDIDMVFDYSMWLANYADAKTLRKSTKKYRWNNAVTKRRNKNREDQVLARRVTVKFQTRLQNDIRR